MPGQVKSNLVGLQCSPGIVESSLNLIESSLAWLSQVDSLDFCHCAWLSHGAILPLHG